MQIGENIKKAREAKWLSQKEVAATLNMDQSQYSKIENGKVDPQFPTIEKIAKAIKMNVVDLVAAPDLFKEVAAYDKTLVEKSGSWTSSKNWKKSLFSIIDGLAAKQKLKQSLTTALGIAQ